MHYYVKFMGIPLFYVIVDWKKAALEAVKLSNLTKMFVMTHKKFPHPEMEGVYPIQVGSALTEDLGYIRDDTGDNISDLNPYYSELTGQYWLWKNEQEASNIGCCHYRRYFINDGKELMPIDEIQERLDEADIMAACIEDPRTWRDLYGAGHNIDDLYALGEVLADNKYVSKSVFEQYLDSHTICFGNMYAMHRDIFSEYMEWLFFVLQETGERIDISGYDTYEKRVFGLLSENLIQIFAMIRGYKLLPAKVAIIAEKSETTELKNALVQLVKEDRISEASSMYDKYCNYRKDVLFSQSDLNGELSVMGKVIHIMEKEIKDGKYRYYGTSNDLKELIKRYQGECQGI